MNPSDLQGWAKNLLEGLQDLDRTAGGLAGARGATAGPGFPSAGLPGVDPAEKILFPDRYEVLEELARGGMAVVFRARDLRLGREVALKALRPEVAGNSAAVSRMVREARAIASLNHPNILKLYDVAESPSPYLVVELVRGRTLEKVFAERGWGTRERVRVLEVVARALHAVHLKGVVHRDLKPGNIMVDFSGRVVVMDFGLAHLAGAETRLTRTGGPVGTPLYMSPEQVTGDPDRLDPRTDVYALGVILYEALTGQPPHCAGTAAALYHRILSEDPVPPRRLDRRVPADLETACLRAMARQPRDRYASALEFAEDLRRVLAEEPIAARPMGLGTRFARRIARRKGRLAAAACLLGCLALCAGLAETLRRKEAQLTAREAQLNGTQKEIIDHLAVTCEACLEAALDLRRAGTTAAMARHAAKVEEISARVRAELPGRAEPHYWWGRMLRALMRDREALAEQERALSKDPGFAPSRYERAILRARLAVEEARTGPSAAAQREALLDDLAKVEAGAAHLRPAELEGARALGDWLSGRADAARERLERAVREWPDLEEARSLLAEIEIERGRFAEAVWWLTEGAARDAGFAPYPARRGTAHAAWASSGGSPSVPLLRAAESDFEEALRLTPDPSSQAVLRESLRKCRELLGGSSAGTPR